MTHTRDPGFLERERDPPMSRVGGPCRLAPRFFLIVLVVVGFLIVVGEASVAFAF